MKIISYLFTEKWKLENFVFFSLKYIYYEIWSLYFIMEVGFAKKIFLFSDDITYVILYV